MTDYIANNVWHLEEQAKRLHAQAEALLREAQQLERTARTIKDMNRKRLGMEPFPAGNPGGGA